MGASVGTLAYPPLALAAAAAASSRTAAIVTRDVLVALFALAASYAWLKVWDVLANRQLIAPTLSRKMVHTTSVPLFMLTWPLFSADPTIPMYAASRAGFNVPERILGLVLSPRGLATAVPAILAIRLVLAGTGLSTDTLVNALARQKAALRKYADRASHPGDRAASPLITGDRREALQGPLYYCIAVTFCTFLFWRGPSPIGILALIQLCVGDGLADVVGRRWRTWRWPFRIGGVDASQKTVGGTLAFIVSAFVVSCAYVAFFHACGCVQVTVAQAALPIGWLTLACAAVELLAPGDDNITVPLAACLIGMLLFPSGA